ncbi:uncharacterized protein LOC107474963 [Arachis duranensis]|uniref:DUF674 family protein n=3 Tax=Arachis TaxID=3817 RepID=A0A445EBQ8_ARAHY|nr:uncharacterized protein LOC107474963 [Arachis duranensis]XP_029148427.1 uncharacterized protein LOC112749318 [Arachis hypogaea]QHO54005.1 uncharacterized protein DS421_2g52900 [Arachis hypogaea]RYR72685.1 hypothetical protein Ahy_A02g006912 [Arachis hypogaea]
MASNMAPKQEQTFTLRLLVDREKNRVVVAEASGDFIDTLFSFLTLPLGTIIRLLSNNQQHDQPAELGCISNLYQSVENSSVEVFWNHICKEMLLRPQNNCEPLCRKLKLNVDDTESLRYFMCSNCKKGSNWLLSTFTGASCCSCGKSMDKEMKLLGDSEDETHTDGVFVKGEAMYFILDDLRVLQSSPNNFVKELTQLGYRNFHKLIDISPCVGLKEILDLLKQALTSKSALSDVFFAYGESLGMCTFSPKIGPKHEEPGFDFGVSINLKVILRKSKKKIVYAEAEGDFVDFLFSFLTAPLGSILNLLDGYSSLGCIDNLYKSVKELNSSRLTITRPSGTPLLDLRVAPQFSYRRQPLKLPEEDTPSYWYGRGLIKNSICYVNPNGVISKKRSLVENPDAMKLFDPRSPDGTRELAVGFVKRPSLFVVWDDLKVMPLANASSICFIQKMNLPLDDLEEHVLCIREVEALNLLRASLTSKAALTEGLSYLLENPNQDAKA